MAFSFTQVDTAVNTAPASAAVTFSSRALGAADTFRHIVVAEMNVSLSQATGVTIAGVTATQLININDGEASSGAFWIAAVPTGTTGDIVVTYATTRPNCAIVVFRMIEGESTAFATASDTTPTSNALSASLEIPTGGAAAAIAVGGPGFGSSRSWTWTNLTEQTDTTLESPKSYSSALSTSSGTLTRTATASDTISDAHLLVMVSFSPQADQPLVPGLYSDGDTFFSATVTPGAIDLTPALYSDGDTFFSATVTPGAIDLTPALYSDGDTFFSPTLEGGAADIQPPLYSDADTFYPPEVAGGIANLLPSLYNDGDTFYSPSISLGEATLSPPLIENSAAFYSPRLFGIPSLHPGGDADERIARVVSERRTVEAFD